MKSIESLTKAAGRVEDYLRAAGVRLKHTQALEVVARVEGAKCWNVLQQQARKQHGGNDELDNEALLARIRKEAETAARTADEGNLGPRIAAVHRELKRLEHRIGDSAACVQVEYDPKFFGGDYSSVGDSIAVPLTLVDLAGGDVGRAFDVFTGLKAANIVHYTLDEVVDSAGEELVHTEEASGDAPALWIGKNRPMTEAELEVHTEHNERYVDVVVDVDWSLLGDIEALNDEVSERITGGSSDLSDISYANYFPTDQERKVYGEPQRSTLWIRVSAAWDPMD